jgi:hypothetical protein
MTIYAKYQNEDDRIKAIHKRPSLIKYSESNET